MKVPAMALLITCSVLGQEAAPPDPVPPAENRLAGWMDLGYRWRTGVGGSENTYRSVVNLGSGPKLMGLDMNLRDPGHRLFDDLHVQAYDWPDPYSTLRVDAARKALYRFSASYRNLTYFNNLPSYADPLLARGIVLDEQSFDTKRHLGSLDLQLLPSRVFSPFLGIESDVESGRGARTFVTDGNEYPVPFSSSDRTRLFRGGLHFTLPRMRLTIEQGGLTYRENQNSYSSGTNSGNAAAPVLGATLNVASLTQAYGVRGSTVYSKANLSAQPLTWLDISGRFLFALGQNHVNYIQRDSGSLLSLEKILFYSNEQLLESAAAKLPHTAAEAGVEIRPVQRLRVRESWGTDRLHNSGSGGSDSSFLGTNYNHADTDASFDLPSHLTVRAGYSRIWGDATNFVVPLAALTTQTRARLRRNVLNAGATWRMADRLALTGTYEHGFSGGTYFRTSLYDYDKARLTARYQLVQGLNLHVDYTVLSNRNPLAGSPYRYLAHQESASVEWFPAGGATVLDITYEHCGYHTEISYIDPTYFLTSLSRYRENCHTVTAGWAATLPRHVTLKAGGAALLTSSSRPTSYFQPTLRLGAPVAHNLSWFAEWRYYGFGESYYQYENFRAHLFSTGLRLAR